MKRFRVISCLVILLAALAAQAGPAQAQLPCGARSKIIETLDAKYQETLTNFGIAGQKNLLEVFSSKAGSWTITMTTPEGITCIMAAGQSWEAVPLTQKLTGL